MYTSLVPASRNCVRYFFRALLAALAGSALAAASVASGNQYVDARICAGCHARIAASHLQTGMGRSFFRPAPANTVEDYTNNEYYHSPSETHYSMTVRGGVYYQRRWQTGFGGKESNIEESRIDYVLGSGNHSRSYLHRTARGTLIELPLGWYAERGGHWGMSPGFDSTHPATRRLASYECIFCHDGYPRIPPGHEAPGSEPVFSGDLPEGIDCQRCHGPGGTHVDVARAAGATRERIRASIVNPARLSAKLRMEVCLQCHLEPTSTAIPSLIRRFQRGPFSFTPGQPLEAFLLAFDYAPGTQHEGKFEIVGSSTYRLQQSRCFRESKGALTCDTCHDPHRALRGEEAVRHYSQACRECHAAAFENLVSKGAHPASADCVSCHMPKRRTEDVVHVVMTDHRVERRPPPGDLLGELTERHHTDAEEYHGEVVPYYPPALSRSGPDALYLALAQVMMKNNLREGTTELARLMALQQPREPEWYIQLGDSWLSSGEPARAVAAYQQAVRLKPQLARGLRSLAKGLEASGRLAGAEDALRQALDIASSDAGCWYQFATLASKQGRGGKAIERLQKAIALDPDLPGAYTTLAGMESARGERDRAEAALEKALRIDPYDGAAWDLAGRDHADKHEFTEAFYDFEKAIRSRPQFAPYLYDFALTLTSASKFDRAQESAAAAARADPRMAEPHALLGGLLARERRMPEAVNEYQEALRLRPDFGRARLGLASALVSQGDKRQAIEQLRQAVKDQDPQVAQLAADALRSLGEQ